jgi:APA family basic amino acid/polyamine antiporter
MTLLTIGAVIGSGIFLVPGDVAIATAMNPLLASLVWVAGAALSLCGAAAFAELSRIRPEAGGLYVYIRDAHGPVTAFVFGWMSLFVNIAGTVAALAAAAASLLRPYLPDWVSPALLASGLALLLGGLNLLPARRGGEIQGWTAAVKFVAVFLCAIVLITRASSIAPMNALAESNPTPLHPDIIVALISVLWAFEGWQYATCAAGEAKDARRSVAFGLVVGVTALAVVYLLTSLAVTLWLTPTELRGSSNVVESALRKAGFLGFASLVTLVLPVAILSAAHATLLTGSRVVYAMAVDRLMPSFFSRVSGGTGIPNRAVAACTLTAAILAWLGTFDALLAYVIVTSWLFYGLAGLAVFRLAPDRPRPLAVKLASALFCVGAAGVMLFGLVSGPPSARYGLAIAAFGWMAAIVWFRYKSPTPQTRE